MVSIKILSPLSGSSSFSVHVHFILFFTCRSDYQCNIHLPQYTFVLLCAACILHVLCVDRCDLNPVCLTKPVQVWPSVASDARQQKIILQPVNPLKIVIVRMKFSAEANNHPHNT